MRDIVLLPILSLGLSLCYSDKQPWKTLKEFENDVLVKVNPGTLSGFDHHHRMPKFKIEVDEDGPRLWPRGRIPYKFATVRFRFSSAEKKQVRKAIREFHRKTCIRFYKRRRNERDFIKIVKVSEDGDRDSCSSYVGRIGGAQEITLGPSCYDKSTIIHELMHALGFYHEHSRRESRDYVTVRGYIPGIPNSNIDVHRKHHPVVRNSPYDICSIMHYGKSAFNDLYDYDSKCPHDMGEAKTFSKSDLKRLLEMYKC